MTRDMQRSYTPRLLPLNRLPKKSSVFMRNWLQTCWPARNTLCRRGVMCLGAPSELARSSSFLNVLAKASSQELQKRSLIILSRNEASMGEPCYYTQAYDPLPNHTEVDLSRLSQELQGYTAERLNRDSSSSGSDTTAQPCNREPPPTDQPGNTAALQPPNAGLCRSSITSGRSVCIAVGSDICTEKVLKYAAKYICKPQDSVTLVHIVKGPRCRPEDTQTLEHAKAMLLRCACGKVKPESVCLEAVPAGKHVGQSLVAHCLDAKYHILVTGNRGLSGMKTKLLSLVGEGSVSRYCAEHLPRNVAVVVVRPPEGHQWCK